MNIAFDIPIVGYWDFTDPDEFVLEITLPNTPKGIYAFVADDGEVIKIGKSCSNVRARVMSYRNVFRKLIAGKSIPASWAEACSHYNGKKGTVHARKRNMLGDMSLHLSEEAYLIERYKPTVHKRVG